MAELLDALERRRGVEASLVALVEAGVAGELLDVGAEFDATLRPRSPDAQARTSRSMRAAG